MDAIEEGSETSAKKVSHTCVICEKSFSSESGLTTHFRIHTGEKPFACSQCGRCFSQAGSLKNHLVTHEDRRTKHECPVCQKTFLSRNNMLAHQRNHTELGQLREYHCSVCDKRFSQMARLRVHMSIHKGAKFACEICQKEFTNKYSLFVHTRYHTGEKQYSCDHCSKAFYRSQDCRRHILNAHSQPDVRSQKNTPTSETKELQGSAPTSSRQRSGAVSDQEKTKVLKSTFQCSTCKSTFKSKYAWIKHERNQSCRVACDACGRKFASEEKLRLHMQIHVTSTCRICSKVFYDGTAFRVHVQSHEGKKTHACQNCAVMFSSAEELVEHRCERTPFQEGDEGGSEAVVTTTQSSALNTVTHLGAGHDVHQNGTSSLLLQPAGRRKRGRTYPKRNNFKCPICRQGYSSAVGFRSHQKVHGVCTVFPCPVCGIRFDEAIHLQRHLQSHAEDKLLSSKFCQKSDSGKMYLVIRPQYVANPKMSHICHVCHVFFASLHELENHKKTEHAQFSKKQEIHLSEAEGNIVDEHSVVDPQGISSDFEASCSPIKTPSPTSATSRSSVEETSNSQGLSVHSVDASTSSASAPRSSADVPSTSGTSGVLPRTEDSSSKVPVPVGNGTPSSTAPLSDGEETFCISRNIQTHEPTSLMIDSSSGDVRLRDESSHIFPPADQDVPYLSRNGRTRYGQQSTETLPTDEEQPENCNSHGYNLRHRNAACPWKVKKKTHKCPICQKSFFKREKMLLHKWKHDVRKSFPCPVCTTRFVSGTQLQQHLQVHTGDNLLSSQFCVKGSSGKTYIVVPRQQEEQRLKGKRSRPAKNRPATVCSVCCEWYPSPAELRQHVRTCHGRPTKPKRKRKCHECSWCGRKFLYTCDFLAHQKIHRGQRSFPCPACETLCPSPASLQVHLQKHASDGNLLSKFQQTSSGTKTYIVVGAIPFSEVKKEPANQTCGEAFASLGELSEHGENPSVFPVKTELVSDDEIDIPSQMNLKCLTVQMNGQATRPEGMSSQIQMPGGADQEWILPDEIP